MGEFKIKSKGNEQFNIFSNDLTEREIDMMFNKTIDATHFLKKKSGVKLPTKTYSQVVLPGYSAQEKSNYSLLGLNFGPNVSISS